MKKPTLTDEYRCHCHEFCLVCVIGMTDQRSIAHHNLRVACHGERHYNTPVGLAVRSIHFHEVQS